MSSLKKLFIFLTITNVSGCATTREESGAVLMEDVIVQRTTVRSTKENPRPKSNGSIHIEGDNINIGTIVLNSPGAVVDNSTKQVQVQENLNAPSNPKIISGDGFTIQDKSSESSHLLFVFNNYSSLFDRINVHYLHKFRLLCEASAQIIL